MASTLALMAGCQPNKDRLGDTAAGSGGLAGRKPAKSLAQMRAEAQGKSQVSRRR
jgi:hypothetical protein